MNEELHWNKIAHSYEDEIFDVFKSDKDKKLPFYFDKYSNRSHYAIDLGCGIGKAFRYLSPSFKKVLAVDISDKCLDIAANDQFTNIEFKKVDLTDKDLDLPPADFGFCCNVLLLPDLEKNIAIINNAYKSLKKKSAAVFVMPSLDSILFYAWRLIEWNKKEGVKPGDIPDTEFSYFSGSKRDLFQGLIRIDGVTTKHYSHSEIEVIFKEAGFKIQTIDKIEYAWETEFASPPAWLKDPYPWDWLVECSKS
ncbi:MAG: class I SAM-dependent methyltransferase [Cyclobacteriaceae bacterium]